VHESIIFDCPPPTCRANTIALLLQDYCAIYDAPPTPLCMPNTIQYWSWQYRVKAKVHTGCFLARRRGVVRAARICAGGIAGRPAAGRASWWSAAPTRRAAQTAEQRTRGCRAAESSSPSQKQRNKRSAMRIDYYVVPKRRAAQIAEQRTRGCRAAESSSPSQNKETNGLALVSLFCYENRLLYCTETESGANSRAANERLSSCRVKFTSTETKKQRPNTGTLHK